MPKKVGRKSLTVGDAPCQKVESKLLKGGLSTVAWMAQENDIEKEIMLQKLAKEAFRSHDWKVSAILTSLNLQCQIPIPELKSLIYLANLSQRQYQICTNLLVKYGISSFEPRNKIDEYKKRLYPSVAVNNLSASVKVKDLFDSTLHAISLVLSLNL